MKNIKIRSLYRDFITNKMTIKYENNVWLWKYFSTTEVWEKINKQAYPQDAYIEIYGVYK